MKFEIISEKHAEIEGFDLALAPVFEDAKHLPKAFGADLLKNAELEGFKSALGQAFTMHTLNKRAPRLIGLIGLGKKSDLMLDTLRKFGAYTYKTANARRSKRAIVELPKLGKLNEAAALQVFAEGVLLARYRFDKYITEGKPEIFVEEIHVVSNAGSKSAHAAIDKARAITDGVCLARDLINEGPWTVNPEALAKLALQEGRKAGLEVDVLDEKDLAKENMNLMLAVAKAASNMAPPRLIRMAYRPKKKKQHVMLVGKGVTFDTGGLNLKPSSGMWDMKVDMAGAACVLATMLIIAKFKPDVAVTGIMPCVENGIGGNSYHPGDVIKSRKGLTVEINNTDAEGRLILADALDYGQSKDNPDIIIDLATLTGAIIVGVGNLTAGTFANEDKLANDIIKCGESAGEHFWRMPINDDLAFQIKSQIADMRQTGDKPNGGSIVGALFLKKFIGENVKWAHLDIAGPATTEREHPYNALGGTGFGVRTLVNYLCG